jgi:hypothetical protein
MTIGLDQAPAATAGQTVATAAGPLPELTPEKARELAALLAEHMMAMRAVTAGTPYATASAAGPSQLSPATEIFIAGMLERICAGPAAGPAADTPAEGKPACPAAAPGGDDAAKAGQDPDGGGHLPAAGYDWDEAAAAAIVSADSVVLTG